MYAILGRWDINVGTTKHKRSLNIYHRSNQAGFEGQENVKLASLNYKGGALRTTLSREDFLYHVTPFVFILANITRA